MEMKESVKTSIDKLKKFAKKNKLLPPTIVKGKKVGEYSHFIQYEFENDKKELIKINLSYSYYNDSEGNSVGAFCISFFYDKNYGSNKKDSDFVTFVEAFPEIPSSLEDLRGFYEKKLLDTFNENKIKQKQHELMYFNFASRYNFKGEKDKPYDNSDNHYYRSNGKRVKLRISNSNTKKNSVTVFFDILGYNSFTLRKTTLDSETLNEMMMYHLKLADAYEEK